jgi:P pilus assembly chaperone PapD
VSKGSGAIFLQSNGNNALEVINNSASVVNYLQIAGAVTGSGPVVLPVGSDGNITLNIQSKGTGSVVLFSNGNTALRIRNPSASAVNFIDAVGSATGLAVQLNAVGGDSNIDLQLNSAGSGLVQFGAASNFTANGAVATTMTSLGPTGSHTTVQEWLTVKDSAGTVRYIPAF